MQNFDHLIVLKCYLTILGMQLNTDMAASEEKVCVTGGSREAE